MLTLNVIANILFIAIASASIANLYDDCLQDDMLFSALGKILQNEIRHNIAIEKQEIEGEKVPVPKWKMPIGGCIICTNVWITILMFLLFAFCPLAFLILAVIGISNTALKFIIK
jgi:hypothetical protein